jgi:hypothetical protein
MRLFISGGAPLPKYAGDFMVTAMNVPVLQVGSGWRFYRFRVVTFFGRQSGGSVLSHGVGDVVAT